MTLVALWENGGGAECGSECECEIESSREAGKGGGSGVRQTARKNPDALFHCGFNAAA
jgi:hypothetical protein